MSDKKLCLIPVSLDFLVCIYRKYDHFSNDEECWIKQALSSLNKRFGGKFVAVIIENSPPNRGFRMIHLCAFTRIKFRPIILMK